MADLDETIDTLFDGGLKFYQSRRGYRFSLDAILLANFTSVKASDKVADLGTGNGVIPLVLLYRVPLLSILGVEVQAELAERARRNVEVNGADARIQIVQGDVRAIDQMAAPESFDAVFRDLDLFPHVLGFCEN